MRAYIITIQGEPKSVEVARRCYWNAAAFGFDVSEFAAVTPKDDPRVMFEELGWPTEKFDNNRYSRPEPCMATFLSHSRLWLNCFEGGGPVLILEHDAFFKARLPDLTEVDGCCNLGHPSFGKFKTPEPGLGPLVSKPYFPGAHAYYLTPSGAERLLAKCDEAEPTDIFLSKARFPWLQEFYPWPVVCDDSFSTIQNPKGCEAKHNKVEVI